MGWEAIKSFIELVNKPDVWLLCETLVRVVLKPVVLIDYEVSFTFMSV